MAKDTHVTAPTSFVEAKGIRYALVFFVVVARLAPPRSSSAPVIPAGQ